MQHMAATLYLEDGSSFRGKHFGAKVSVPGEVGKLTPKSSIMMGFMVEVEAPQHSTISLTLN